jgi:hypothetical protein
MRRFVLATLAIIGLVLTGCDRAGPNQTVVDCEIYLDVRGTQAVDRWLTSRGIETHDIFTDAHRALAMPQWLDAAPRNEDGPVPETLVVGPVMSAPAPLAPAAEAPVEKFPHKVQFILRDKTTQAEQFRRELKPGYNTFKVFLDSSTQSDAGLLYRGNLLLAADLDWSRGRHQAVTISVLAEARTDGGKRPNSPFNLTPK